MEYRIGICDEDYHYVVNLMDFVNSYKPGGLRLVAFSSLDAMDDYLKKEYLDGALVGGEMKPTEDMKEVSKLRLISLYDIRNTKMDGIYKYQNVQDIVEAILRFFKVDKHTVSIEQGGFVAVYSPLGRCGKTSLAKGLALTCKNALYVGFEEFERRDLLGERILYNLIIKNSEIFKLLSEIKQNEYGIYETKGVMSYLDIRELKLDSLIWLKTHIFVETDFEKVIFDVGQAVFWELEMLEVMDRVYVPVLEDDVSMVKLQGFRELMRDNRYTELEGKLKYIDVPDCHYASELMRDYIDKGELKLGEWDKRESKTAHC